MNKIQKKTLDDLEFSKVLQEVAQLCQTEPGRVRAMEIIPFREEENLVKALNYTNEYLASFDNNNTVPNHYFEDITKDLQMLGIENSTLEIEAFRRIVNIAQHIKAHLAFFNKFAEYYPTLHNRISGLQESEEIIKPIEVVIDRFGEIKDDASSRLMEIRRSIQLVRGKINQSFNQALSTYAAAGYLDDIRETVVENRRVLAVTAMYRRKIKGIPLGTSKTGSIIYMEPESTQAHTRELANLIYDEGEEIKRILLALSNKIRPYKSLLEAYQKYLTLIDVVSAKARYAKRIGAILPEITSERQMYFQDAYHPLLLESNRQKGEKTYPQTIRLDQHNRIIVISGPNAGGKSITLKTAGLLQLMLQSGLLIPVKEGSCSCLFDRILTDIGDNQSIENHLSTYSYRLKNMNFFLRKCNDKTLFLIDEFGTGSDPELGGALAETFLEVFYEREAFGIITTHYANLKVLANELPHAINANMQFDNKTLEPVYKLVLGEAGSSFTFEVAQKNGIPYSLINKARKKIERGKVRFDETIAKLQKERNAMHRTTTSLKEEEAKKREESKRLEELNAKIQHKLESYQELYDHNQRMIYLGNKINDIAQRYFNDNKRRPLIAEFLKIVETENSKRKRLDREMQKQEEERKQEVAKELIEEVKVIRQKKKEQKKKAEQSPEVKPRPQFKVGDRVRMTDGKAVGSIDALEKGKALVNYGIFTTSIKVDQLELVESKK